MKHVILEFRIPEWALCPLINGDYSALNEQDIEALEKFTDKCVKTFGHANFSLPSSELEYSFYYSNDIDNLGNNCTTLLLMVNLYKVYKIGRKRGMNGRRKLLGKNMFIGDAKALVNSYPDSNRSMVIFTKQ